MEGGGRRGVERDRTIIEDCNLSQESIAKLYSVQDTIPK